MKKIFLIFTILITTAGFLFAENTIELKKADMSWSVDNDDLTISIEAETKGWIAVGLGSTRMDGSVMFMGYNKDNEAFFEEHLGKGHSHKKTAVQRPVVYSVSETDGITKLEFTIAKSDFVKGNQKILPIIVAYGARDNFTSMHRYRDSAEIIF